MPKGNRHETRRAAGRRDVLIDELQGNGNQDRGEHHLAGGNLLRSLLFFYNLCLHALRNYPQAVFRKNKLFRIFKDELSKAH